MRRRITERVAASQDALGPQQRFLANVIGVASTGVLELIDRPGRQASVLMPIIDRPGGLQMLFTARADHLAHHPGQVAFPGGRVEEADASAAAAALREAEEEVGLAAAQVELIGAVGAHMTGTGFVITPFVGFIDPSFIPKPDPAEVAAVFEVPLDFLFDIHNCQAAHIERFGTRFLTYEFHWDHWRIWGATAAMVVALRELIHN